MAELTRGDRKRHQDTGALGAAPRRILMLVFAFVLTSCDDGKPAKETAERISSLQEKVATLESAVAGLQQKMAALEMRAKGEQGPTQDELVSVIREIDAVVAAKAQGGFATNYRFLGSDKEGDGVWKLAFGHQSGQGPQVQARVRKVATGWVWIKGDVWLRTETGRALPVP